MGSSSCRSTIRPRFATSFGTSGCSLSSLPTAPSRKSVNDMRSCLLATSRATIVSQMDDVAAIARPGAVAQYHRSISLLRKLGVPTATLAHLFHTSPENIRKVDSRAYEGDSVDSPPLVTDLLREFADDREWEV